MTSTELIRLVIDYPAGTLLFLVALLNFFWVMRVIFAGKNYTQKIYQVYFFYAVFVLLWVLANAYFQSGFLFIFNENVAKSVAIFANITSTFAIVGFFLLASLIKNRGKISQWTKWFVFTALLIALALNLMPDLTVKDVHILEEMGDFELIFGPWNNVFFGMGVIFIFFAFYEFISAVRQSKNGIQNRRIFYILFAMSLMYGSLIIFHIVLPNFFMNYKFVWVPPLLSMADVAIVGYAIVTKRFIDIRTLVSRFFKALIAFFIAILLGFPFVLKLARGFPEIPLIYWEVIGIALIVFFYNTIMSILNSREFYRYFGGTDAEHIRYITNELRQKSKIYTSIKDYEKDIRLAFKRKLRTVYPQIIMVDETFEKNYPQLMHYFQKNRRILVTEELKFEEKDEEKMVPLFEELESLGGICLPLLHPSKGLVGLFTLGQKKYNHLYSKAEIAALETLGSLLNATVTSILYNFELQAEVDAKTKELKHKIEQINELVDQQSDFIAVTAHEFRTPLTIASFLLEDVIQSKKKDKIKMEELKVVETSLENLKELTEKLFAVQQYDLNKVGLNLEKTELKAFLKGIHKEFLPLIKEKQQIFTLNLEPKDKVFAAIDRVQLRQVLHNLLKNASKFTSEKGAILMQLKFVDHHIYIHVDDSGSGVPDSLKKSVFEKFRTKSSGAGIGLGLYLCKKIIELHQGKIWVDDSATGGASFIIKLKVAEK